jgi:D-glycero-D-manno-heptose 1,7-bisphosphate phosphatase
MDPPHDLVPGTPAVFLDRDGVINKEVHYLNHPDQLELIDGVTDTIGEINKLGLPVVIITNQSAIARGKLTEEGLIAIHDRLLTLFAEAGCHVSAIYASPYHPDVAGPYGKATDCRKPNPGMPKAAAEDLGIDLGRSVMIGDKRADLGVGRSAGMAAAALVRTGHGASEEAKLAPGQADIIADDMATAFAALRAEGYLA